MSDTHTVDNKHRRFSSTSNVQIPTQTSPAPVPPPSGNPGAWNNFFVGAASATRIQRVHSGDAPFTRDAGSHGKRRAVSIDTLVRRFNEFGKRKSKRRKKTNRPVELGSGTAADGGDDSGSGSGSGELTYSESRSSIGTSADERSYRRSSAHQSRSPSISSRSSFPLSRFERNSWGNASARVNSSINSDEEWPTPDRGRAPLIRGLTPLSTSAPSSSITFQRAMSNPAMNDRRLLEDNRHGEGQQPAPGGAAVSAFPWERSNVNGAPSREKREADIRKREEDLLRREAELGREKREEDILRREAELYRREEQLKRGEAELAEARRKRKAQEEAECKRQKETSKGQRDEGQRLADAWEVYDQKWKQIVAQAQTGSRTPLTFATVPWPLRNPPSGPEVITCNAVGAFLLGQWHSQGETRKDRLRNALLRWHPDRFEHRYLGWVPEGEERDLVEIGVQNVARALNELLQLSLSGVPDKASVQP